MTTKELKQQIKQLQIKAATLLAEKQRRESMTWTDKVIDFLDTVFSCADPLEIWLPYPSNHNYEVSSNGRVRNISTGRELIANGDGNGYLQVAIYTDRKRKTIKVHKMVAQTFIVQFDSEANQVNHIDSDKTNNDVSNLEWVTSRENRSHYMMSQKKNQSSQYIGVTWYQRYNKWKSSITVKGKTVHLGYFDTEEEGRDAYQRYIEANNISNRYAY